MTTSRISGFYNMTLEERHSKLAEASNQTPESLLPFTTGGLSAEAADHMIENVIGLYSSTDRDCIEFPGERQGCTRPHDA